jgi:tetratricopeptide (TPR) repeat protein
MLTETEFNARATPWLDRIEALDPGNGSLLGFRARFAAGRGNYDDARQLFERAVASAPNDTALGATYAGFLRSRQENAAAVEQLDRVLRLDPANSSLHVIRAQVLRRLHRFDDAIAAAKRAIELDPQQPNAYGALAEMAQDTGDAAGRAIWLMAAHRVDPKDHEIPTMLAEALDDLGEYEGAKAWIGESLRIAPGHVFPEARSVTMALRHGEYQAALDRGLAFIPREAEDVKESWLEALSDACIAGGLLGRGAEVRARLEQAKVMPRELTAAGFRALDTSHVALEERLLFAGGFLHCLFGTGGDDATRKKDLLGAYLDILGPDWAKPHWRWFTDGFLRGDRERMVQGLLPEPGRERQLYNPIWIQLAADYAGLADEPQLKERMAEMREKLAQARAALPQRLKEQGLSLMP